MFFLYYMRNILNFIFSVFLTAIAYYFSTGFNNIWILAWLAPIPICLFALESSGVATFFAGFLSYLFGTLSYFSYIHLSYFPFHLTVYASLIDALVFAIILLLFRYMAVNNKRYAFIASFMFAFAWTGFEFIRSLITIEGTFQSLAYTQTTVLPLIQIVSLVGIWGITFLLMLIPSSIVLAYFLRRAKILVIPGILLIFTLLFGVHRLYYAPQDQGPTLKVGMAAVAMASGQLFRNEIKTKVLLVTKYDKIIARLAKQGAQIVLLPEDIIMVNPSERDHFVQLFSSYARKYHVYLIAGMRVLVQETRELYTDEENTTFYNIAYFFAPNGRILMQYHKQHPYLNFERHMIRGSSLDTIDAKKLGRWGIAICKDVHFFSPLMPYSKQGINILFSPALNVDIDGWLHGRVAVMQGIAGNFVVARAAQQGLLSFSDSRGRVLDVASTTGKTEDTLLFRKITTGRGQSLYSQFGDWFAWLCIVALGILVIVIRNKKKT